jgi:hypothetical protein
MVKRKARHPCAGGRAVLSYWSLHKIEWLSKILLLLLRLLLRPTGRSLSLFTRIALTREEAIVEDVRRRRRAGDQDSGTFDVIHGEMR